MSEEVRFDGRVVIVTGAGAGLGRAYALLFASRGASVVVNDLGGERSGEGSSIKVADAVVSEIKQNGGKAVANHDSVLDGDKIVKTAIDKFQRIDIVVNNAGILRDKSFVNMTEQDWDLIHNVHLKGAFQTTRAAWPYFRKQGYGRVILTSSCSGLYGNYGQVNYAAAKMGLIGFGNALAIEGSKYNIHTNIIVPTAASRLTKDILPPDLFTHLKPELIAPVVLWLCHESCNENGSIIESALGWAGKYHLVRSSGNVLRQNLSDVVTLEAVRSNWASVTEMSTASHFESIQDATADLINVLQQLEQGRTGSLSRPEAKITVSYTHRDAILYALGVGASLQDPSNLRFLSELHEEFAILPTFFLIYCPIILYKSTLLQDVVPGKSLNPATMVHGEQYLEINTIRAFPIETEVEIRFKVEDVLDKESGAVILVKFEVYNNINILSPDKVLTAQLSIFAIGGGNFGGPRTSENVIPIVEPPSRKPDMSITQQTSVDQAVLYRLSGDFNPLHVDQDTAELAGFAKPILHGLCTLGFSVRHVLQAYAANNPDLFKSVKARFAKPVYPGQTLRTDMWREDCRIHFATHVVQDNSTVISGAYVDMKSIKEKLIANPCFAMKTLQSDVIFLALGDYVKTHRNEVKKIDAVYLCEISDNEIRAQWTLDFKRGEVYRGKPASGKPDTKLYIKDRDMVEMIKDEMEPEHAFLKHILGVKGDMKNINKLKGVFAAIKSKL